MTPLDAEWLEADGLGGFASGTVGGARTRRYHALLLTATTPPTGRMALVLGLDATVDTGAGPVALSTQRYVPDVESPQGHLSLVRFDREPWPCWTHRLPDGTEIRRELVVVPGTAETILRWRSTRPARLEVRLFVAGRDHHALHHENSAANLSHVVRGGAIVLRPYDGVPAIQLASNGNYHHGPQWYRQFLYVEERARGLDHVEDAIMPGVLTFDLGPSPGLLVLSAGDAEARAPTAAAVEARMDAERARRAPITALDRAAEAFVVRRGRGRSIIAGYPWFTDWGRDTFIALRGLLLGRGRASIARDTLLAWSEHVSEGMLPNLFPDGGARPEYNAVDASLWFVVTAHEYLSLSRDDRPSVDAALRGAILAILTGYARGTRYHIGMADDGLLAAGAPGVQLTWMDAKYGAEVITPRSGKPVEVQALWINALTVGAAMDPRWAAPRDRALAAFSARFWDEGAQHLHDVVDVDHVPGQVDTSLRPNQIFAVGGLPHAVISGARARAVVDRVEAELWTPLGLRSLAPSDPAYAPHYAGGPEARDRAYHQGTVWPWLTGAFVEAWLRVRGFGAADRAAAEARFLAPLMAHLETHGLGHVSEIADGAHPHHPAGCPFQAWSLGELLRARRIIRHPQETHHAPSDP